MDQRPRVLIVAAPQTADDPLTLRLDTAGFTPVPADGPLAALREVATGGIALVLIDLGFTDGLRLCERLRAESSVPIVLLATHAREADRVLAFELGADHVVDKPYMPAELVARIRALLRRDGFAQAREIEIGDVRLDPVARRATKRGQPLALAPRQFDLLHVLMQNAGSVVPRDRLMNDVWNGRWFGSTKTLDVHIAWLRAKIEDDPSRPRYITTLRGTGFRFASPAELADAV